MFCSKACALQRMGAERVKQWLVRLWNSPRCGMCGYDGPDDFLNRAFWGRLNEATAAAAERQGPMAEQRAAAGEGQARRPGRRRQRGPGAAAAAEDGGGAAAGGAGLQARRARRRRSGCGQAGPDA